MTRFSRRAYLNGALGAVAGLSGVAGAQPDDAERGPPGRRGRQDADPTCPPGTTLLATYEPQRGEGDVSLEHVSGDDVVSFESIERRPGDRVAGFEWTASAPVALVEVAYGPNLDQFEGGFEGAVDRSGGGPRIDAVRFCAPRGGRAHAADVDLDLTFEVEHHRARPADQRDAGDVLHVQSVDPDDPTRDYALSAVNLLQRRADDEQIAVDDVETLSFDYYQGPDDGGVVPDGVFVVLLPDADDQLRVGWEQAAGSSDETWETFDVLEELDESVWRVVTVGFDDLHSGRDVLGTALRLRDNPERTEVALADAFADATLAGVAVGAGSTSDPTTVDRYYDRLVVETADVEERFRFPATVPADVEVTAEGSEIVATLSLASEAGISVDDVDEGAVTLATFGPIVPPVEPELHASGDAVEVEGDELRVGFPRGPAQQLLDRQTIDEFLVAADLDLDDGSAIYGVGEWD